MDYYIGHFTVLRSEILLYRTFFCFEICDVILVEIDYYSGLSSVLRLTYHT